MKLLILLFLALVSSTVIIEAVKITDSEGKLVKKLPPKTVSQKPSNGAPTKKGRDLNDTDTHSLPKSLKETNPANAIDVDALLAEDQNNKPEIPVKKKKPNLSDSINVDELLAHSDNDNELPTLNPFGNDELSPKLIDPRRLAAPLRLDTLRNIRQHGVGTGLKGIGKTLSIGEDVSDFFSDSLHEVHDFVKTLTGFVDAIPIVGEIKRKADIDISNGIELERAMKGALFNSGSKIFQNAGEILTDQVGRRRLLQKMRSRGNTEGNTIRSNRPRSNRLGSNGPKSGGAGSEGRKSDEAGNSIPRKTRTT